MKNKILHREKLKEVTIPYRESKIDILESLLEVAKETGATHFDIYASMDSYDDIEELEVTFLKLELESDEVLQKRITAENLRLKTLADEIALQAERMEKELLRKLKNKYEN